MSEKRDDSSVQSSAARVPTCALSTVESNRTSPPARFAESDRFDQYNNVCRMSCQLVAADRDNRDWITNIGTGKASLANVQLGEATRMLFALGLNKEFPKEGMNFVELQLCRRCYWSVYTSDK